MPYAPRGAWGDARRACLSWPAHARARVRAGRAGSWPVYAGGLAGVPHSPQNFAVALRSALQFVQCLAMGVPHSAQNFEPTRTALWHWGHSIVAASAGAAAGAGAAAAGAAGGAGGG